jgi:hypothetical protein
MYLFPKTITKELDKQRRTFFWQGVSEKKLPPGQVASDMQKQEKGGLGIKGIEKMNLSLLCKLDSRKGLWQDIIRAKYMRRDTVVKCETQTRRFTCVG